MSNALLRRFRRELRERGDIRAGEKIVLSDAPERTGNTRAAELLLRDALNGRVEVSRAPDGLVCGSRDEAAALRLKAYTEDEDVSTDLLLSSLTASEIETYLKEVAGEDAEVYVPDTPEARFLSALADAYGDVRYGL